MCHIVEVITLAVIAIEFSTQKGKLVLESVKGLTTNYMCQIFQSVSNVSTCDLTPKEIFTFQEHE